MNPFVLDLSLWRFPASLLLGTAFGLALWAFDRYYRSTRLYRVLSGLRTAVGLVVAAAVAVAVEGIRGAGLYRTWPFVAVMLLLAAALGLAVLRGFRRRRDAGFLLLHGGMFVVLWAGLFGAPDVTEARMLVRTGTEENLAYTADGRTVPLPFGVRLDRFTVERYDDGTPRCFRSEVRFGDRAAAVEVNAPVRHGGYTFYQDGYDTHRNAYTVLLVVRDPWLPAAGCGAALLAAGALFLLLRRK